MTISTDDLAYLGFRLNERTGHLAEALEISVRMSRASERRNDKNSLQAWLGNRALILQALGRLEEALALHKKKEAICLELGKKDSLGYCY